jgi:hypothetical protein
MKTVLAIFLFIGTLANAQVSVPFTSDQWTFSNKDYVLEEYLGRPSVLLKKSRATLKGARFETGIIEYDVAFGEGRDFIGVVFRMQDEFNYEEFYLRAHQSGNPDANQYTPVYGSVAGWQLYHGDGYGTPIHYTFNNWMHVKLVMSKKYMDVYLNDMNTPIMFCEFKRPSQAGYLGVQNALNQVHFANFTYTAQDDVTLKGASKPVTTVPGTVMQWQVSGPFSEKSLDGITSLKMLPKTDMTWKTASAENTGTVNLASLVTFSPDNNSVFAKVIIDSDKEQVKKFRFGFSDRARVYFNGNLLFSGEDDFQTRDYRFLGTIGYFDAVYLPLKKGLNEIQIAVSETFGGWGVRGKFDDVSGIKFVK